MYIEAVPNRGSPPAILLRESFRDQGRVRKRTLASLSAWPTALIEGFRTLLKGGVAVAAGGIRIRRALPHGHAAAVLGTIRAIGLDGLLGKPSDKRLVPLAMALIASRLISPVSKLATARELATATAASSLGWLLGLGAVNEVELYRALDWLGARQGAIETLLARRHLQDGALVLYDVSSSWLEGRCCELARFGHSRDGKKGKLQIVYGLLCAANGCPVAVEVFEGNTADPMTLSAQIDKLKERFGLSRVVLVGDRGMITSARIRDELKPAGLDWITALRAPQIRALLDTGAFQLSLFDERDLAEITAPEFPGERLVVCKNPLLAEERARKREELLQATEAALAKLADQIARGTGPKGQDKIARAVGRIENRYKLAKLFDIVVAEDGFTFARNPARIATEARLDGFYVIRTSVEDNALAAADVVGAYKGLARVERAFRSLKTVDLHLRPIHHWLAPRVRAHVFLCMLACHVEWHMRERLKPMLFDDDDPTAADPESGVFRRVASGGHADLLTVERAYDPRRRRLRSDIVVEDTRAIAGFFRLTAAEEGWRIAIVNGAEEMNRNAANALLKILEEPPRRGLLLLVSHSPGRLLPTIRSRCRHFPLAALARPLVLQLFGQHRSELSRSDSEALAGLAEGSVGRAIELADAGGLALYKSLLGILAQAPRIEVAELYAFADKLARPDAEEAYRASEELLSQFLARMVVRAAGRPFAPEELVAGEKEVMQRLAACANPARWADLRDRIGRDFANTDQLNLDRKQAILGAFFSIEELAR